MGPHGFFQQFFLCELIQRTDIFRGRWGAWDHSCLADGQSEETYKRNAHQESGALLPEQSGLLLTSFRRQVIRLLVEQRELRWAKITGATMTRLRGDDLGGFRHIGKDGENIADDGLYMHWGLSYYA